MRIRSKHMLRTLILSAVMALAMQAGAITYSYDDAGRLAKADYGDGRVITYTYDAAGNLLRRQVSTTGPKPQNSPKPAPKSAAK